MTQQEKQFEKVSPVCPVFGECGGCQFQDIPYAQELGMKEKKLRDMFIKEELPVQDFMPIVASPKEYHYRCRLDMKFLKIRSGEMFMGFSPQRGFKVVEVDQCPIAMEPVSDFLPELKRQACAKIPAKYRDANLTVKTGDDGRVFWGGIGRRSLRMLPEDFLWTEIEGKRIFYSLDTFFQANLPIIPELMKTISHFNVLDEQTIFFDLYGGVGLFGILFADLVQKVVLIEENVHAVKCAQRNVEYNNIKNVHIIPGRVEDIFSDAIDEVNRRCVAMIDPPRAGLSESVIETISESTGLKTMIYLSCQPESLVRDLKCLAASGWESIKAIPFDFFPKTKHIETLVLLRRS